MNKEQTQVINDHIYARYSDLVSFVKDLGATERTLHEVGIKPMFDAYPLQVRKLVEEAWNKMEKANIAIKKANIPRREEEKANKKKENIVMKKLKTIYSDALLGSVFVKTKEDVDNIMQKFPSEEELKCMYEEA